ncbi:lysylphosphatidylglycerol synthase domain-containing protein [Desulforhopalus vacuolatus]|uniref:lysylphosphatidylglycerol synthase domain-containing protein n=1 Tax=Desulforhopalus vacuolatus TaxID=40414 RepID=UPI00308403BD
MLFFGWNLYKNIGNVTEYQISLHFLPYFFSTFLLILVIIVLGVIWKWILADLGCTAVSTKEAVIISVLSWFGRYVPGKVGMVTTKYVLGRKKNISTSLLIISSLYENAFIVLSAFIICLPGIVLFFPVKQLSENWEYFVFGTILFCLIGFVILLYFCQIINVMLFIFNKELLPDTLFLRPLIIAKYLLLYSFFNIINGLAFYVFISSITEVNISIAIPLGIIYVFSAVVGLLVIIAPAGIGVKEGVMLILLYNYLPQDIALVVSAFSRLWSTLADLIVGIIGWGLTRIVRIDNSD